MTRLVKDHHHPGDLRMAELDEILGHPHLGRLKELNTGDGLRVPAVAEPHVSDAGGEELGVGRTVHLAENLAVEARNLGSLDGVDELKIVRQLSGDRRWD